MRNIHNSAPHGADPALAGSAGGDLGEGSGGHLDPPFVGGVDLQVVAVGAVKAQEATAWKASIVTWRSREKVQDETQPGAPW